MNRKSINSLFCVLKLETYFNYHVMTCKIKLFAQPFMGQ